MTEAEFLEFVSRLESCEVEERVEPSGASDRSLVTCGAPSKR
jgi:hypothetical protein